MEDNVVYFDKDTPKIEQANKVRSLLAVNGDDETIGSVEFDLLVLEAGKHVGDTVKIDGLVLPTLGEGNKRATVRGGSTGKTFTYGSTTIEVGANMVADLFWDGTAETWSKVEEVEMPQAENKIHHWTAKAYTEGQQVLEAGQLWEAVVNTTAAQKPGVVEETIWKKLIKGAEVVNNLTYGGVDKALSAEQGKELANKKLSIDSDAVTKAEQGFDFVFREIEDTFQYTTEASTSVVSVVDIHGYSFPIGQKTAFNKVELKFAQKTATPVTQIEVRFLKETSEGDLISKQTFTITTTNSAHQTVELVLDTIVDEAGKIWMQVLTNNPITLHRSSPAVVFSAAAGYAPPYTNSVNDLDAEIFPDIHAYVDFYVRFNSGVRKVKLSNEALESIDNSELLEGVDIPYNDNLEVGYIDASGDLITDSGWRTTPFIEVNEGYIVKHRGRTSLTNYAITFYDENFDRTGSPVGYSNNDVSINEATVPAGVKYTRMSGTVSSTYTVDFKIEQPKIKPSILPETTYNSIKKEVTETWNAIGHSIWWQDGRVYSGTSNIAKGIQTLVRRQIQFSGYNNYGYSGASLTRTDLSDANSILNKTGTWVAAKIWTFDSITNDHKRNRPLGAETDFLNNTGGSTFYGALRVLHDTIKALQPDYLMICASPLQKVDGSYTSFSANPLGHTLKDYTDALLFVANRLSWRFVDQFNNSGINMENISLYTTDGLHPTDAGYEHYAGLWINEFYKL